MKALDTLLRGLHRLEDLIVVVLLLAMISLAVTQIVLRNGFDSGLPWADSLLRVLVLWIALAGAVVGSRQQQHISMDLLTRFLAPGGRRVVQVLTDTATAILCVLLAWYCLGFVRMEREAPSMAFATVPTWWCESIMPVAFGLIALRYATHALRTAFFGLPVDTPKP